MKLIFPLLLGAVTLASGCASYGVIGNNPSPEVKSQGSYSIMGFRDRFNAGDTFITPAFSGGGTRAAALSYGLLKELRDTSATTVQGRRRLLDEVKMISSVSGGSFTAAYYGLYGERIFDEYEGAFLRQDVQGVLIHRLLNPFNWFRSTGRTEWSVRYYDENVFRGATFADMLAADGPMIFINASDLSHGLRFWFTQEYFNLLCSDISDFPVARAVAASSAVPGIFNPLVLRNYPGCNPLSSDWIRKARQEAAGDHELEMTVEGLESYSDKENRPYVHLVDGGITDNLGLRGLYQLVQLAGGIKPYYRSV